MAASSLPDRLSAFPSLPRPLTPLVGREREIGAICDLLLQPEARLVTLIGPGGIGKTRMALAVAERLQGEWRDGAAFVALQSITDPELVVSAIAQTAGVREIANQALLDSLAASLQPRHLLLVLDNFEQVLPAAPLVSDLLAACPDLTILVTSRAVLHLYGERAYPIPPLDLPDLEHLPPLHQIAEAEAIRLFVERAQAATPTFALTTDNAPVVAAICARVDSLPLAIELAAARTRLLSPSALLARLERRLPTLAGGPRDVPTRQQTVRDTIAWSYDLLPAQGQKLFRQLAVFADGWMLEAAGAVCASDHDVFEGLATLFDQSLVWQAAQPDGSTRFGMLETIREYGLEQLDAAGETGPARRRHLTYFLELAERSARDIRGPRQKAWLERLEAEHNDLRAALRYALDHDPAAALRLGGALYWFWFVHGHINEGVQWLRSALAGSDDRAEGARALALAAAGGLLRELNEFDAAVRHVDEAIDMNRAIGDTAGLVFALSQLAVVWMHRGELTLARPLLEEGIGLARQIGDQSGEAFHLGILAFIDADLPRSEQSLALKRELGEPRGIAMALGHIGNAALLAGDHTRAEAALREGLALARELDDRYTIQCLLETSGFVALEQGDAGVARERFIEVFDIERDLRGLGRGSGFVQSCVEGLAGVAFLSGLPDRAARLFGAAEGLREQRDRLGLNPLERAREPTIARMRAQLSAANLRQAWSEGRALPSDDALALAFAPLPSPAGAPAGGLSIRELEVVRLVVEGHSNQEIAAALFISPNTVTNHVANIMNKLGLDSRTAVATWAVRNGIE